MTQEKKYNLILILLCFAFFWLYSYLIWSSYWPQWSIFRHLIFNWPDESANYFFSQLVARANTLIQPEDINGLSDNLVHARSVNVLAGGSLVPMTFLPALLVFGLLAKIFGSVGILFLTPALAAISVYLIYRLVFYIFKKLDLAFLVALLLLPLAPWLYFANMTMLPNILFIFLVAFGWLAILKSFTYNYKKDFWWFLGSMALTLAVFIRPTEIVWLTVFALAIIYWYRDQLDLKRITSGIFILAAATIVFLFLNKVVYGDYWTFGYFNLQTKGLPTDFQRHSYLSLLFAPFGFDAKLILLNFYQYFIKIIPLHFVLALSGFVWIFFKSKIDMAWKNYLAISSLIFIIILIYYGSWQNPDPLVRELNTISVSHVRYFLPLYILTLPYAALIISKICRYLGKSGQVLKWIIIIALGVSSFKIAFLSANDGLLQTRQSIANYYEQFATVQDIVPQDSVIISERSDKVFWPYYKVVVPQGDLPLFPRIATFIEQVEVYYYTDASDQDLGKIKEKAQESGLYFSEAYNIDSNFRLYKINNSVK